MRKLDIYVETSVWGMVVNEDPEIFREAAESFFRECAKYNVFISPLVLNEIKNSHESIRKIIERKMSEVIPSLLRETLEVRSLANAYIVREILSPKYRDDALHIAYATANEMDYLLSFNFRHIVHEDKRALIKAANLVSGYNTPRIVWPGEIVEGL